MTAVDHAAAVEAAKASAAPGGEASYTVREANRQRALERLPELRAEIENVRRLAGLPTLSFWVLANAEGMIVQAERGILEAQAGDGPGR